MNVEVAANAQSGNLLYFILCISLYLSLPLSFGLPKRIKAENRSAHVFRCINDCKAKQRIDFRFDCISFSRHCCSVQRDKERDNERDGCGREGAKKGTYKTWTEIQNQIDLVTDSFSAHGIELASNCAESPNLIQCAALPQMRLAHAHLYALAHPTTIGCFALSYR